MKRRNFLKLSGLSSLPLAGTLKLWASSGEAENGTQNTLVCLFLRGGADGLNIVVPAGDPNYYDLRPSIAIPEPNGQSGSALELDGYFGLHPAMADLLPLYDAGSLAFIHATGLVNDSHSHFDSQDLMEKGVTTFGAAYDGWLNRHLSASAGNATFRAMSLGTALPRSLAGEFPAIGVGSIDSFGLVAPDAIGNVIGNTLHDLYQQQSLLDTAALNALAAIDELSLANPGDFPVENGAQYPPGELGSHFRELAQILKAGLGVETACIDTGGWDHHENENQVLPPLLTNLAQNLNAFNTDLGSRMQQVSIIVMTEFGRRAFENASGGTDHGHGNIMLALGGGVQGGQVYGNWPGLGDSDLVFSGDLAITTDYRTVLAEALASRLGQNQWDKVFPDWTPQSGLGIFH